MWRISGICSLLSSLILFWAWLRSSLVASNWYPSFSYPQLNTLCVCFSIIIADYETVQQHQPQAQQGEARRINVCVYIPIVLFWLACYYGLLVNGGNLSLGECHQIPGTLPLMSPLLCSTKSNDMFSTVCLLKIFSVLKTAELLYNRHRWDR